MDNGTIQFPPAYIEQFAYLTTRLNYDKSLPLRATLRHSASHLSLLRDGHVSRFECRLDLEHLVADLYLIGKMKITIRGLSQSRRLRDGGFQPFSMVKVVRVDIRWAALLSARVHP